MQKSGFVWASAFVMSLIQVAGTGCGGDDSESGGAAGSSGSGGAGGYTGGSGGASGGSGGATGGNAGTGGYGTGGYGTGGYGTGGYAGASGSGTGGYAGAAGGAGGTSAGCSGTTPITLTVKNYLSWCSVAVAGQTASSAAEQKVCVAAGATELSASALSGFKLGSAPWHHTDGDTGYGELGTVQNDVSSVTVTTASGEKCVWICCEFTSGGGCPTTDQCP